MDMLDADVKKLAQEANFAAFTTMTADGLPSTQMMWVDADDEHVLINTEVGRQKFRRVQRDPRVGVMVFDPEKPYRYAEIRGRVVDTVNGDEARDHIDRLSEKYRGEPYDPEKIGTDRVILKIEPDRQRVYGGALVV
jgi:PPOX class probable F420-dependent enzyme